MEDRCCCLALGDGSWDWLLGMTLGAVSIAATSLRFATMSPAVLPLRCRGTPCSPCSPRGAAGTAGRPTLVCTARLAASRMSKAACVSHSTRACFVGHVCCGAIQHEGAPGGLGASWWVGPPGVHANTYSTPRPPLFSTPPPPPPAPCRSPGGWGGNCHVVNQHKNACCGLKLLCVAPLLLLPTVHIVAGHCQLHCYSWVWVAEPCSHLEQM